MIGSMNNAVQKAMATTPRNTAKAASRNRILPSVGFGGSMNAPPDHRHDPGRRVHRAPETHAWKNPVPAGRLRRVSRRRRHRLLDGVVHAADHFGAWASRLFFAARP